jgi:hypothetical protein
MGSELSVFKGREARLNRAIFWSLSVQGTQTTYELHRNVRSIKILRGTHYANVNKRVRALEQLGYVKRIGVRKTKAGFESTVFEMTSRAYLAILMDSIDFDDLLARMSEDSTNTLMITFATLK